MSGLSAKTQERLLYFISPIGLLLLWQVLLMLGIGDRRFVPAPSDIAWRYWELVISGELARNTAIATRATLEASPNPNASSNSGISAIFGIGNSAAISGSKKMRTGLNIAMSNPTATAGTAPMT